MTKYKQGLKDNEFTLNCRQLYDQLIYVDVENDPFEGSLNIKGSVQRNRKIINSLT